MSSEYIALKDAERRKAFPKFVGPFKALALRGINNVEVEDLSPFGRFKFIDKIINVERLTLQATKRTNEYVRWSRRDRSSCS